MFLDFYQMREQPFGGTPDPRFLYLGKSHREALASLFYGMEADSGFTTLIANPGLGKTTLTFQLLEKLQRVARTVFLCQTQCNSRELLHYVLNDLGVDAKGMDIVSMHNKMKENLSREMQAGRRFVLAIDEAQNLDPDVLETIRLLSNFETSRSKLLHTLLIGQPQLARKLASPALVQLQQRISVFARLEPFGLEETARYIAHRLQVAGYDRNPLFTPGALEIIQDRSQGIPRNINRLCFSALSLGCAMGHKRIDSEIIGEVVADQNADYLNKPLKTPRAASVPATAGSTLFYRRPTPKRWLPRWAVGTACVAASMAVGIMLWSSSSIRIGRFLHTMNEVSASVRSAAASTERSTGTTPASSPIRTLGVKSVEIPDVVPIQPSPSSSDVETTTVVVQSGDDLRQIALRTMGQYSGKVIEQIRKLNPAINDPNHLEVGQKIRLPLVSVPLDSGPVSRAANTVGRD